jgi:hypothetical protein
MTTIEARKLVQTYFDAESAGNVEDVVALFCANPVIRNAANPPLSGPDAPRKFCEDFYARTQRREFRVLGVAEEGLEIYAWWEGTLTFKAGVRFGDITTSRPFSVTLRGVCRFELDAQNRKILELDVFHETTTAAMLAREHA